MKGSMSKTLLIYLSKDNELISMIHMIKLHTKLGIRTMISKLIATVKSERYAYHHNWPLCKQKNIACHIEDGACMRKNKLKAMIMCKKFKTKKKIMHARIIKEITDDSQWCPHKTKEE